MIDATPSAVQYAAGVLLFARRDDRRRAYDDELCRPDLLVWQRIHLGKADDRRLLPIIAQIREQWGEIVAAILALLLAALSSRPPPPPNGGKNGTDNELDPHSK
jgi:hypothetical protein